MAAHIRRTAHTVMDFPRGFLQRSNFFQAIRLLLARANGKSWPLESRVRFRAEMSHAFPGREISAVSEEQEEQVPSGDNKSKRYLISTPNYCIAGGLGPLPPAYTEWMREQSRVGNETSLDFLNLFNHRLNVTRYRLKENCTPGLNNLSPEDSILGRRLAELSGLSDLNQSGTEQSSIPTRSLLGIASLITNCRRSSAGLTRTLSRYLGAPVLLTPFVGAWRPIEKIDRMILGQRNNRLGQESVLGSRVWDQQARVRLTVGPLDYSLLCRLLPPREEQQADVLHMGFVELVSLLLNRKHDCEVRIEVRAPTVGLSVLTSSWQEPTKDSGFNNRLCLGKTAWLVQPKDELIPAAEFLIPAFGKAEVV